MSLSEEEAALADGEQGPRVRIGHWIEIGGLPFSDLFRLILMVCPCQIFFWIEIDSLPFSDLCWQYCAEKLVDGRWMDGCSLWSMGANPCMYDVCMLRN